MYLILIKILLTYSVGNATRIILLELNLTFRFGDIRYIDR